MTYRRLFAPLIDRASAEPALNLAISLAQNFGAEIDAAHLRQDPPIPTAVSHPLPHAYAPFDPTEVEQAADALSADLKNIFESVCADRDTPIISVRTSDAEGEPTDGSNAGAGFRASFTEVRGLFPDGLAARARTSDITVMTRPGSDATLFEDRIVEEVLFASGRPVLLGAGEPSQLTGRILVGWDGGREAARALAAALPILQMAGEALVLTVGDVRDGAEDAHAAARYLSLHGVAARAEHLSGSKGSGQEMFLDRAGEFGADLIVCGAYSHSRLRQLVLGGFTRLLLRESSIPLLLAH